MKQLVRAGFALGLVLAVSACGKDKKTNPLHEIPVSDPVNAFNAEGGEFDAASASGKALSDQMGCEIPSTEQRLQGPLVGAHYRFIYRRILGPDIPRTVRDEEVGITMTDVNRGNYTKSTQVNEISHRGESALGGVALHYTEECSMNGCDANTRKFISGSALYKYDIEAKERTMMERESYLPQTRCSLYASGESARATVQNGTVNLSGVTYRAVKFVTRQRGQIECRSGITSVPRVDGKTERLGAGERVDTEIVLADKLPVSPFARTPISASQRGCSRSPVFSSSVTSLNGKPVAGTATDIANAKFTGTIWTVAEYRANKARKEENLRLARARVDVAMGEKNSAETKVVQQRATVTESIGKEQTTKSDFDRLEQISLRPGATPEQRQAALEARNAWEAAVAHRKTMEELLKQYQDVFTLRVRDLAQAEADLRRAEAEARN